MAEEERVGASGEKSFEDAGDVAPMEVDRSGNGDSGHDRGKRRASPGVRGELSNVPCLQTLALAGRTYLKC